MLALIIFIWIIARNNRFECVWLLVILYVATSNKEKHILNMTHSMILLDLKSHSAANIFTNRIPLWQNFSSSFREKKRNQFQSSLFPCAPIESIESYQKSAKRNGIQLSAYKNCNRVKNIKFAKNGSSSSHQQSFILYLLLFSNCVFSCCMYVMHGHIHTSHTEPNKKNWMLFFFYLPFKHYEMPDCLPLSHSSIPHFIHTRFGVPRRFHCYALKITYEMEEYISEMGFCPCGGRMRSPDFSKSQPVCARLCVVGHVAGMEEMMNKKKEWKGKKRQPNRTDRSVLKELIFLYRHTYNSFFIQ